MRAWLTGRHSFGYFSVAVDRKVTCCRSTTDTLGYNLFHYIAREYLFLKVESHETLSCLFFNALEKNQRVITVIPDWFICLLV